MLIMVILVEHIRRLAAKLSAEGGRITFLGTGSSDPITEGGKKSQRNNTSSLINYGGKSYLIDVGPTFDPETKFDYLLITHQHDDAFGGFHEIEDREFVFALPTVLNRELEEEEGSWSKMILDQDDRNELGNLVVIPFKVEHDVIHGFPTFGYQFILGNYKLTYASDMVNIPEESEKYFDDVDMVVADGAGWESNLATHFGIIPFLELVKEKEWNIDEILFTQIGRPVPEYEKAQQQIKEIDSRASLAYDGLTKTLGE